MSGIVRFLRRFYGWDEDDESIQASQVDETAQDDYQLSLASHASPQRSQQGDAALIPPDDVRAGDTEAEQKRRQESGEADENEEHEPLELVTLEQWQKERNELLSLHMTKRLVRSSEQDQEEREEDYESFGEEENEEWDTQQQEYTHAQEPETQDGPESPAGVTPVSPSTSTRKRRKKVPHVDDTTTVVSSLDSIDLHSNQVNLSLLKVEKVLPIRHTRRAEWQDPSTAGTAVPCSNGGTLPMYRYKFFEDDGPLGTICKFVLVMEVRQLNAPQTHELKEATAAAFGELWKPSRMRIFFYGKYAQVISSFLDGEKPTATSPLLLRLERIPAKCVLPYETQTSCLFERETMSEFCLCISQKSGMKINKNGEKHNVRFDNEHVKVTVASPLKGQEISLGRDNLDLDLITPTATPTLVSAYEEWKKLHEEKNSKSPENGEQNQTRSAGEKRTLTSGQPVTNQEGTSPKRQKATFQYQKLNELQSARENQKNSKVEAELNLFGAVIGFSSPTQTKKGDWMITISIVDETLTLPGDSGTANSAPLSITVIVFCREQEDLPKPRVAGDVLRCHRVAVQEWQGDIQLVGRRRSSYVMIRPKEVDRDTSLQDADNWSVVPTAKKSFSFVEEDHARAVQLWNWGNERILSYPTLLKLEHRFKLSDMRRNGDNAESLSGREEVISRDMTVMVTALFPYPNEQRSGTTPRGFLRVWDGTGPPISDPLPIATPAASGSIRDGDPPSGALVSIKNTVGKLHGGDDAETDYNAAPRRFSIVSNLEAPKCLCGCVVNVAIWEEPHWDLVLNSVPVGTFIRLRHVREKQLQNGLRCLMVFSKSHLTPLPDRTYEVRTLLEDHQKRVLRKDQYNPKSGLLPLEGAAAESSNADRGAGLESPQQRTQQSETTPRSREEAAPTASFAQCISGPPAASYLVKFRIVRTAPDVEKDAIGLRSLCVPNSDRNSASSMKYHFAVRLNDGETEIDAVVSNDLAASLLGRTADEACESSFPASQILHVMTGQNTSWNGRIRSVILRGARYCVLDSVSVAKRGSGLLDLSLLPPHTW